MSKPTSPAPARSPLPAEARALAVALAAALAGAEAMIGARPGQAETVECVLARVNDEIVTLTDYERQKRSVLEDLYRQKLSDAEMQARMEEARDKLLPSLIEERLLMQKAADLGLHISKEDVDRVVQTIMEQNRLADEAALDQALKAEGLTLATLRDNVEKRSLVEKLKQYEVASRVVVTDEEAKRWYTEHRDDFKEAERVRLREIVLLLEKRDEGQVRSEIEELAALVRNGADFAELATLFSQAPTAEHGGDLGLLRTEELSPEIAAAAAELAPDQVSTPVKTKFGYHILKLVERKATSWRSFEESREDIVRRVQDSRYGERMEAYVEELKRAAFIQVNEACKQAAR